MDNQFRGNNIRRLAADFEEVDRQIKEAKASIGKTLQEKRGTILHQLDARVKEIKD